LGLIRFVERPDVLAVARAAFTERGSAFNVTKLCQMRIEPYRNRRRSRSPLDQKKADPRLIDQAADRRCFFACGCFGGFDPGGAAPSALP
jgi:hypothetical protein